MSGRAASARLRAVLDTPLARRPAWALLATPVLALGALLVALVAALRRASDDAARARGKPDASSELFPRLTCVGNVIVGGAGKSPVAQWLLRELLVRGERVALVARGYGAGRGVPPGNGSPLVARADTAMEDPRIRALLADEVHEHLCLLEAALGAGAWKRCHVVQGADRAEGLARLAHMLERHEGLDAAGIARVVPVMDDGLQHFQVRPRTRVCVWNEGLFDTAPRAALPLGPYREGWPGSVPRFLRRFDLHVWSRLPVDADPAVRASFLARVRARARAAESEAPAHALARAHSAWLAPQPVPTHAQTDDLAQALRRGTVILLCGVANPDAFERDARGMLRGLLAGREEAQASVGLAPLFIMADHALPTGMAADALARCERVVTTAKDASRLRDDPRFSRLRRDGHAWVLCVTIHVEDVFEIAFDVQRLVAR